jgi:hypothetical protein
LEGQTLYHTVQQLWADKHLMPLGNQCMLSLPLI